MATGALAGFTSQVYAKTGAGAPATTEKIAELKDVTIHIERDTIDASSHSSVGWKDNILGLAQWTASAEWLYVPGSTIQQLLYDALINRTVVHFRFVPKGDAAVAGTDEIWEGDGIITSWELAGPNDDAQGASVEILGSGALTRSTVGWTWG